MKTNRLTAEEKADLWSQIGTATFMLHRAIEKKEFKNLRIAQDDLNSLIKQMHNAIIGDELAKASPAIKAEVHSDDYVYTAEFDATAWFEQASDKEILELAAIDWGGDYAADAVAEFFENTNDDIAAVFDYLSRRQIIGFECHVDKEDALKWIEKNRSSLIKEIRDNLI